MDKIKRKILSGAVLAGCALIGLGGISLLSHRNAGEAIPTSLVTTKVKSRSLSSTQVMASHFKLSLPKTNNGILKG